MIDVFDVLDIVEAKVQTGDIPQIVETLDMGDDIIVEIKVRQTSTPVIWEFYARY